MVKPGVEQVRIDKLVHGGQGLGALADGRKVFVWNALPGEVVRVRLIKKRRDYAEGVAEEIVEASPHRIAPRDEAYLSTSPWQIMDFDYENEQKRLILEEAFARERVAPGKVIKFNAESDQWHYRNKMEYSFWGDDDGLHLALFNRGSHGKRIVSGSSIARPEIDAAATRLVRVLAEKGIRAGQLKTAVLRCSQDGEVAAALFVKDDTFPEIPELATIGRGLAVIFSNPKSPASVVTRQLYRYGDTTLTDRLAGRDISYDVLSFFQVNLPVFQQALERISNFTGGPEPKVDLYSGVGTIGLCCAATTFVELDEHNVAMARLNMERTNHAAELIQASSETALASVTAGTTLIVDPPRAGLHRKLIDRINEVQPPAVIYLSCNPATQARDIALLQPNYQLAELEGYNFFPRTPHIESLAVLKRQ